MEKKENVTKKLSQRICYLCGRNEAELKKTTVPFLKTYQTELKKLENELKNEKKKHMDKHSKILKATEGIELDFTIGNVTSNLPAFRKIIPGLDMLLEYNKKASIKKTSDEGWYSISNDTKLSEIRSTIEKYKVPKIVDMEERIENFKEEKKKFRLGLKKIGISLRELFPDVELNNIFPNYERDIDYGRKNPFKIFNKNLPAIYVCDVCDILIAKIHDMHYGSEY